MSEFTLYGETARCRLDAALLKGRSRAVISQTTVSTTAVALDELQRRARQGAHRRRARLH